MDLASDIHETQKRAERRWSEAIVARQRAQTRLDESMTLLERWESRCCEPGPLHDRFVRAATTHPSGEGADRKAPTDYLLGRRLPGRSARAN